MSQFKLALLVLLASSYIAFGQMDIYYSASQPGYTDLSFSPNSGFAQPDEGLTPASGHYLQRNIQVTQIGSDEVKARIPNLVQDSGQVRSDGTFSSYANVGSSAGASAQAFLGFDISSIPKEANIRSATLEFEGWNMVGSPFSKLGCLNIMPTSYSLLGSQSYSNIASTSPFVKICSSGQLNLPITSQDLTNALQASLGQGMFQLRLQFDRGTSDLESGSTTINRVYSIVGDSASSDDYLSSGIIRKYTSGVDSANNYLSGGTSLDRQTLQDMGFDQAFLQSDFSENGASRISKYIVLTPDLNLSKLGITQEMIEKAIDPGRLRIASGTCGPGMVQTCTNIGNADSPGGQRQICICEPENSSQEPVEIPSYREPVKIPSYREPVEIPSYREPVKVPSYREPVEIPSSRQTIRPQESSQDLIKIGVAWLTVAYSLPQLVPPQPTCNQLSCQAQSKPAGAPFSRDGKEYQSFSDCSCIEGKCQCKTTEKETGPAQCDQQVCESRTKAIGSAYLRDGKTFQEFSECFCMENNCRCGNVEREIKAEGTIIPPPMVTVPGLGNASFKPPDSKSLIKTSEWGEVPANQILVMLKNGSKPSDIEALASIMKGRVVGYLDFINLYQIETSGITEADLMDSLTKAKAYYGTEMVSPHQQAYLERSPLEDSAYGEGRARSYEIAGVQQAWDLIKNSSINLSDVTVGVTDDGLYRGYGEFSGEVKIDTTEPDSELKEPALTYPKNVSGSHGTGIMNILAADPNNGGLVGIASMPIGKNLKIEMINVLSPTYTNDPGQFWFMGCLNALMKEIGNGSTILSCSWGNSEATELEVLSFKNFFTMTEKTNKTILFVCSAGNDGKSIDGSRRYPSGHNLSNVITVGSILNNGKLFKSNKISSNFEVTLAAPGEQAVWGMDDKDKIVCKGSNTMEYGGTSMATPFVAAAAALIRSIDPNLSAKEIKAILRETARTSIKVGNNQVPAPPELGGRILAIDLSVQKAIANRKNQTE